MSIPAPIAAPLEDRVRAAEQWLAARRIEREGFLSDDDILDATDIYTTDAPYADEEDPFDRVRADYDSLQDRLFRDLDDENPDEQIEDAINAARDNMREQAARIVLFLDAIPAEYRDLAAAAIRSAE